MSNIDIMTNMCHHTKMRTKPKTVIDGSDSQDMLRQQDAVQFLQEHMRQPEGYWANFLTNNRRPERRPAYKVPFLKQGGKVLYAREHLAKLLEREKHTHLGGLQVSGRAAEVMRAYGIGTPQGGPYGRKLQYTLTPQSNEGGLHVQLLIEDPLLVFCLPVDQVDKLAKEFGALVHQIKEWKKA